MPVDTRPTARATAQGLLAVLLWSTTVAVTRSLTDRLGVFTAAAATYLLAGGVAVAAGLVSGRLRVGLRLPRSYLVGCGSLFACYLTCLSLAVGLARDPQQVVEVGLINYLWPALTMVLSVPVLGQRARWTLLPGLFLALAGIFLSSLADAELSWARATGAAAALFANASSNPAAYGLALGAAVSWAGYSVLSRRLAGGQAGDAIGLFLLASGLVLLGIRLAVSEPSRPDPLALAQLAQLAYLALLPGWLAYVFWDRAMRRGRWAWVASAAYTTPIWSTLLTCGLHGVAMGAWLWLASGLVVAGALLCRLSLRPAMSDSRSTASDRSSDWTRRPPAAYAGRILLVDLSSGRIDSLETSRYSQRFIGGRGVASAIYFEQVPPAAGFDHPDNRLIVSIGPLAGMPGGLGGSRWGIYAKSPYPAISHAGREHYCYGNLGGAFGAELRFAGWDGIVVAGVAEHPVTIAIDDARVEIRSAEDLWGLSTIETIARLQDGSIPRTKVMAIGPAGENRVPLATVFADGDASCSGGMGAVLGAKKLKAIAVRGSNRRVEPADREALRQIDRQIRAYQRGNVKVWGLDFMAHGPKTHKMPCYGCMAHCLRVRYTADDGTSGKFMCQARFFYLNHAWGHYGRDNDVPFLANRICDRYGIDTWEVQALIEWLLRCHAAGLITPAQTGLDLDRVGSLEFIEELVRMIALRQGFGELLSGGARAASRAHGGATQALFTRTDPYDPRYCPVNTLLFPFETREPIQQLHEAGLVLSQWSSWAKGVERAHVSSKVVRGIAERFWGGAQAADLTTLDGKAAAACRIQDRQFAKECLGVCDWMFPLIDLPRGPDPVGDPAFESRILSAALGIEFKEADLYRVGERAFNLQRAILLREGHRARQDDFLPAEWHDRPIETHVADPDLLAPGPNGRIVSQIGRRADRADFLRIRDEYYQLRGWDVPTGLPSREQLAALDLPEVAEELAGLGLAVQRSRGIGLGARLRHVLGAARARISGAGRAPRAASGPKGASIRGEALRQILLREQAKFGADAVRDNFAGWNKTMQYHFPDIGEVHLIRFVDGVAQPPEQVGGPIARAEISYELDSWVLEALSAGQISGQNAYLKRLLRIRASFADLLKLQSLNKR